MPLSDEERQRIEEEIELRVRTEIRVRRQVDMEAQRAQVGGLDGLDNLSWRRVPSYLTIKRLGQTFSAARRSSAALTVILIFELGLVVCLVAVLALLAVVGVEVIWLARQLF